MEKLFQENLPVAKSDEDLKYLKQKYPNYDSYYIASASIPKRKKLFEKLYKRFKPYADKHFLKEVKSHFHQRIWEMYMACVFIKNKFRISSSDDSPDIKIVLKNKVIWIECVACSKGVGVNAVPPMKYDGSVQDLPEKQMLLRITSSLDEKFKKYQGYLKKGVVKEKDIFIIAINRAELDHFDPGIPLIHKVLFGIEYLKIPIHSLRGKTVWKKPFWSIRGNVVKQNGKEISVKFFDTQEHSGISAVIYSKENILNHPKKLGSECILIHNPLASNPLSNKTFSFFSQFEVEGDKIKKIINSR